MRLSYRSAHSEYVPPSLEMAEDEVRAGRPRAAWSCHTVPPRRPSATPSRVAFSQSAIRPTTLSPAPEVTQLHQANLRRNIERRIQAAQARGDRALVLALETEFQQLLCRA